MNQVQFYLKCSILTFIALQDNDELAEKICKGSCAHLERNCGQMLGCGYDEFDVSKHCPKTCAKKGENPDFI